MAFGHRLGDTLVGHSVELLPQFRLPDALLYSLSMALKTELETSGFGGQLYIDVDSICTNWVGIVFGYESNANPSCRCNTS